MINWKKEIVLEIVATFANGATLDETILKLEWPKTQKRTLQRRFSDLVKEGHLFVNKSTRPWRYYIPSKTDVPSESPQKKEDSLQIPLSVDAEEIRNLVITPPHLRTPRGYNREFLERYKPNHTFYLSAVTRKHLSEISGSNGNLPAGTYAKQIFNRLLIDLSWNSSRLEGNTYSLLETERLLNLNEVVEGKDAKEAQMILNHKEAIEFLVDASKEIGIDRRTVLNVHAILSNDLLGDPSACGRLRTIPVGIGKSVYTPPEIPQFIENCFENILDCAHKIQDPFEQAFFLMVHLPYLQPFDDVNKRVARLVANIPLIINNLCPLSFVDVPVQLYVQGMIGVYELNRIELLREVFIWAYERSCLHYSIKRRELGEPDPFRMRYRELIRETVASIVQRQMNRDSAIKFIRECANASVPADVRLKFIETVEQEIMGMHDGNYARFRIRHSEYEAWRKIWI